MLDGNRQPGDLIRLSPREQEVLEHIAEQRTNGEIAQALELSENTVRTYVRRILDKLDLQSRRDAGRLFRLSQRVNDSGEEGERR